MGLQRNSYLFPYARAAAKSTVGTKLGDSMLGYLAACDARFLISLIEWSGVDTSKLWVEKDE